MGDIENKIGEILSDPEKMKEIMNIASSLGFSAEGENNHAAAENIKGNDMQSDMFKAVSKLAPLLSEVKKEDDSTRLLKALKPLLSKTRQEKVDSAIKIIGLLRLMPVLKESSELRAVFGSIF